MRALPSVALSIVVIVSVLVPVACWTWITGVQAMLRQYNAGRAQLIPNRLSLVVGHCPCLIGANLSGVSVAEVISRPREAANVP